MLLEKEFRIKKSVGAAERTAAGIPPSWSWFSNSPVVGSGLQRERLQIYAWDDANAVYILDLAGRVVAQRRSPKPLFAVAAADTGERIVAIGQHGQVWWLDEQLRPLCEVVTSLRPLALAVDPHGEYAAVAGEGSRLLVVSCTGHILADVAVSQSMNHLAFVPTTGRILAAAEQGVLACHDPNGKLIWKETMFSTVGNMAIDGKGESIFLACYGHGLLRFNSEGRREGVYQVDRSPQAIATDYDGTHLLTSTLDGHVLALNFDGHLLGDRFLGEKPVSIHMDALARFAVLGFSAGEIRLANWDEFVVPVSRPAESLRSGLGGLVQSEAAPSIAGAAWTTSVVKSTQEAASAVLDPVGSTGLVAVFSTQQTVRILDREGAICHECPRLEGSGRVLWSADDWLVATTDRRLLAYDASRNESMMAMRSIYEVSHVVPLRRYAELLLVESCDQVTRLRLPDEVQWKQRLPVRTSQFAAHEDGRCAMVLEDGQLAVLDPKGELAGRYRMPATATSLLLAERAGGWVTASLGDGVLRGHDPVGQEVWSMPLPWDPWSLRRLGRHLIVTSVDGRSVLADESGRIVETNEETRERAMYFLLSDDRPARLYRVGGTILITSFDGRLLWRRSVEGSLGTITANRFGVWVIVDRWLVHFPIS